jgi:hypothetical protein
MSRLIPFKGQTAGFKGSGIERDNIDVDSLRVKKYSHLPVISSLQFPPGSWPGQGGAIAYDIITKKPYFSDGFNWIPVGFGVGPPPLPPVASFSFIKNGIQVITGGVNTVLLGWTTAGSGVYHSVPGWDLIAGDYTAPINEILSVSINISWASGSSNRGNRHLRVQYRKFGTLVWNTVKEVITQADADINVQTTQECQINAKLLSGDSARITVEHSANGPISIDEGIYSSVSGFLINTA